MADNKYKLTFTMSDGTTKDVEFTAPQGEQGPAGQNGKDGKDGSDASVTAESIKTALGYTPANAETVSQLSEIIAAIGTQDQIVQKVIAALPVYNGEVV